MADKNVKNERDENLDDYFGNFDDLPEEDKFDRFIGHDGDLDFKIKNNPV